VPSEDDIDRQQLDARLAERHNAPAGGDQPGERHDGHGRDAAGRRKEAGVGDTDIRGAVDSAAQVDDAVSTIHPSAFPPLV
jgi:hypothetical protein